MAFNWAGLGSVLQGAGSLYGAYNQQKMGKKLFNLQENFLKKEEKRKKRSQARLDLAAQETLGHRSDKASLPIY